MLQPDFPMPQGYLWQYVVLRWIQSFAHPALDQLARGLSVTGGEGFCLVALAVLLWAVNKRMGLRVAYVLLLSIYTAEWLKVALGVIRPIGIPGIRSLYTESATGYALPSGHAQGMMTFWLLVCRWARRQWLWAAAMVLVFAIGVARVYLGLHWPLDVLTGWGLGVVFGVGGWWVASWWSYRRYGFRVRLATAIVLPLVLLAIHQGPADLGYAALLLGVGVGAVLEERYLHLELHPAWWRRACCLIIGTAGLIALKWLTTWPADNTLLAAVRDVLVGLWATLGAPYVFAQCGLYRRGEWID